jgi:hypothetical protein
MRALGPKPDPWLSPVAYADWEVQDRPLLEAYKHNVRERVVDFYRRVDELGDPLIRDQR